MNQQEFTRDNLLFNPEGYGRIYVFVDFGNVRHWARELWPEENKYRLCKEIDINKLSDICNLIEPGRKYFYYGYYAKKDDYAKYKKSIYRLDKAGKAGFIIKSKEMKMIPHYNEEGKYIGKFPKCNFDVEIAMDIVTKMPKYDTIVLFSGDSDFSMLLKYIKDKGKKIIIACTRDYMSTELNKVADKYIPVNTLSGLLEYNKNAPLEKAEA